MKENLKLTELYDFDHIKNPRDRVDAMNDFIRTNCNAFPDVCLELSTKAYSLSNQISYGEGKSFSLDHMAYQHWHLGEINSALKELDASKKLQIEFEYFENLGWHTMIRALILWGNGLYDQAFHLVYDALNKVEILNIPRETAMSHWCLGVFYYDLKDYDNSLLNYTKALHAIERYLDYDVNSTCYTLIGLGCAHKGKGNLTVAKDFFNQAQIKSQYHDQWMQEARTHYELGLVYFEEGDLDAGEKALKRSYKMRSDKHTKPGMVSSLLGLSDIEIARQNYKVAMDYLTEALTLSEQTNSKVKIYQCHHKLFEINKIRNDFSAALYHLEEFHRIKNEVVGEEASNRLKELETKFATERIEKEAEIERLKNVELKSAHDLIKIKNDDITSSILYAKHIQNAVLPPFEFLADQLGECFLLYLPKDIVAGDFYWLEKVDEKIYFAVADCTGHGVPGAMMSMLCSTALTKVVKEYKISSPAKILDKTVELLEDYFSRSRENVSDGMDIALCCFDSRNYSIEFAGANNPMIMIRDKELFEFKGDRQPIGSHVMRNEFTNHEIAVKKNDVIYLFSDGFSDQFGGPKGKKYGMRNFKLLLEEHHGKKMPAQNDLFKNEFQSWQGNKEQIDDVCLLGWRLP